MLIATALVILAIFGILGFAVMRATSNAVSDDVRAAEDREQMQALGAERQTSPATRGSSPLLHSQRDTT